MIDVFDGQYAFLSNFNINPVFYKGMMFTSTEAAFQSQKTTNVRIQEEFCSLNPSQSKRKGRSVELRPDWDEIKIQVMHDVCYAKFTQNPNLMLQLLDTGNEELVEGNTWNDTFWGVCNGVGENNLGKVLMGLREELRNELHVTKDNLVQWIEEWFDKNGPDSKAVIGISGGKDSTVAAALCVEALGKDRVIGVLMPNGEQSDIADSYAVCEHLGIQSMTVNIGSTICAMQQSLISALVPPDNKTLIPDQVLSNQTITNLPPRIRMTTLYAVSQTVGGRVINTSNRSERWVGYSTRWGDDCGDVALFHNFTSDEVVMLGDACELPQYLTHKAPSDGLCGKTDEDNLGFTYATLNSYLKSLECLDEKAKEIIDARHAKNEFKIKPIPTFSPQEEE